MRYYQHGDTECRKTTLNKFALIEKGPDSPRHTKKKKERKKVVFRCKVSNLGAFQNQIEGKN